MNYRNLIIITIFAVAMAFMESAVVIYLRELFYPEGFTFPLKQMKLDIMIVEGIRELGTIVMLVTTAMIAGYNATSRFAYFLWSFAIWDIGYYGFLKVFLDWPATLLDLDILFLLPLTWAGPVITPILLAVLMMALAFFILRAKGDRIRRIEWLAMLAGSIICLYSFMYDHINFLIRSDPGESVQYLDEAQNFMIYFNPTQFPWGIYAIGILLVSIGIWSYIWRNSSKKIKLQHAQLF